MDRQLPARWPWHLLSAVILLLAALGIYTAASRINYQWHWQQIPKFVLSYESVAVRSEHNGRVDRIEVLDKEALIHLKNDEMQWALRVEAGSFNVAVFDDVSEGDIIGAKHQWQAGPLLKGVWTTLWLSFGAGVLGLVIGIATGLCRISRNPTLSVLSAIYVEIVRGTPLLVQLFIVYFFIGTIFNFSKEIAGLITLACFVGAYIAEIVRAGIQSLDKGQMEAARSLGLTHGQAMRYVILPQALKRVVPPLTGQLICLVKDSSLVSVIAVLDLTKAAREAIASSFYSFEIWFTVAAIYLLINFVLSRIAVYIEYRLSQQD